MGKGSNPRPIEIPRDDFRSNWERIFGDKKLPEKSNEVPKSTETK